MSWLLGALAVVGMGALLLLTLIVGIGIGVQIERGERKGDDA